MKRTPRSVLSRGLGLGVLLMGALSAGCSGTYFSELLQTSNIRVGSVSEGLLSYDITTSSGLTVGQPKITIQDPAVQFVIETNSQATTFTSAEVKFFTGDATLTGSKINGATPLYVTPLTDPPEQLVANVPFSATVGGSFGNPGTVPVHLITAEVLKTINAANTANNTPPTFFGSTTIKGTNLMGQAVTVPVNLTVVVKVTRTEQTSTVGG